MKARPHRTALSIVAPVAALLAAAALAWACVPAGNLSLSPQSGPPGTTVTATGSGFPNGNVEIRWPGGRLLRTVAAPGGSFSTTFAIPADASPQEHYVTASPAGCETRDEHACHGSGVAPFRVTGGSPSPSTGAPAQGGAPGAPTTSARARAIARCKKRYRGNSRRAKVRRKSCIAKARRRHRA